MVLHDGYHYFIIISQKIHAIGVCYEIKALRGIPGKDDVLLFRSMYEVSYCSPGLVVILRGLHRQIVKSP